MISRRSLIKSGVASLLYSGLAHAGIRGRYRPSLKQGYARNMGESEYPELWPGLVGAYQPYLQGSGNRLYDFSNYGRDSDVFSGNVAYSGDGLYGRSIQFNDATLDFVSLGTVFNTLLENNFTIEILCKPYSVVVGNAVFAFSGSDDLMVYIADTSLNVRVFWRNLGGNVLDINPGSLVNTWTHIFIVSYGNTDHRLFYGGNEVDSSTASRASSSGFSNDTYIGGWEGDDAQRFDGVVQKVSLYQRALNPTEIRLLTDIPYAPFVKRKRIYGVSQAAPSSPRIRGVHIY